MRSKKHQGRIEHEQRPLVIQRISISPLDILGRPENRPHGNTRANCIHHPQHLRPGETVLPRELEAASRLYRTWTITTATRNNPEGNDLHKKPYHGNHLAYPLVALAGWETAAVRLGFGKDCTSPRIKILVIYKGWRCCTWGLRGGV